MSRLAWLSFGTMRAMNAETNPHVSRTGMTESRWAYLKALRPGFGRYLHVSRGLIPVKGADGIVRLAPWPKGQGKTYDIGRNKAKREKRAQFGVWK